MPLFSRKSKQQEELQVENRNNETQEVSTFPVGLSFLLNRKAANADSVSAFFGGLELISNSIASIPIEVKLKGDNEKVVNHNLYEVFRHGQISKFMLIKSMIQDAYKYGDGLAYIKRSANGMPIDIIYRPHGTMTIVYNEQSRQLYYLDPALKKGKIEPINVLHIYKNSKNGVTGIGLPFYAAKALGLAAATDSAANDFFASGCNISGVLKSNRPLTSAQKIDILNSWRAAFNGSTGANVGILGNDMDFQSVGANSADAQMIESREFNVLEIARYLNVSPILLGAQSATAYNTLEQAQNELVLHTLLPLLTLIEEEFNRKLILPSEKGLYIDFDEDKIMLSSKIDKANYYTSLVKNGVISINEARLELGYTPKAGADDLMVAFSDPNQNKITGNDNENTSEEENGNNQ